MMFRAAAGLCVALAVGSVQMALAQSLQAVAPPVARTVPHVFEEFGGRRADPYDWLRKKKGDAEVVRHLEAENTYAAARLARIGSLIDELEAEGSGRADSSDEGPDYVDNGYLYRRRIAKGASLYADHRATPRRSRRAAEQVVLDFEQLAAGHRHYDLADYAISPDGNSVAFAVDFTGGRLHRIFIRDIASGETVPDTGTQNGIPSDLVCSADFEMAVLCSGRRRRGKAIAPALASPDRHRLRPRTGWSTRRQMQASICTFHVFQVRQVHPAHHQPPADHRGAVPAGRTAVGSALPGDRAAPARPDLLGRPCR